jgi:hypothetical protein
VRGLYERGSQKLKGVVVLYLLDRIPPNLCEEMVYESSEEGGREPKLALSGMQFCDDGRARVVPLLVWKGH